MSQRNSGYDRKSGDQYFTPTWVTAALLPHLPRQPRVVWEPTAGAHEMANVLATTGAFVHATDLSSGVDFLASDRPPPNTDAIICNPPYGRLTAQFVEHALRLMEPERGIVAMLLRTDFGHARTRRHLFADHPAFCKKVELLKRIIWFVEADGKPKASPSENHSWFVWNWLNREPPTLAFAMGNNPLAQSSSVESHHIHFYENKKTGRVSASCTCSWKTETETLLAAQLAASVHDLNAGDGR